MKVYLTRDWASWGPINMSESSSSFDPRAQCARNKNYKLWCHHMELGELSAPLTRYACAWCASRWGGHADRNYGKAWSLRSRRFWGREWSYSCITQRKAVRSVSPMKKSKTCACFDGEISDGKSTMRLVIVAHLGCVVFLLRCHAVLCLSRSQAVNERSESLCCWRASLLPSLS